MILGLDGNDTLQGGPGNDRIEHGIGQATVSGNEGDDTIYAGHDDSTYDGGPGNDTINFSYLADPVDVTLGNPLVTSGSITHTVLGFENVVGTVEDDTINGDGNDNVLDGGPGNDFLCGNGGNDTLIGGPGNDLACAVDDTATTPATVTTVIDVAANETLADEGVVYDWDIDFEIEQLPLVYTLVDDGGTGAVINPDTGEITVTPDTPGVVVMTYMVERGDLSSTADVTLTVTQAPPPTTTPPTTTPPTTTPPTTAPPTTVPGGSPTTTAPGGTGSGGAGQTTTTSEPGSGSLPITGTDADGLTGIGLGLVLVGATIAAAAKRRRRLAGS